MIESCPSCNYALAGLPDTHACPECGIEYDAETCVWPAVRPRSILLASLDLSSVLFPAMLASLSIATPFLRPFLVAVLVLSFGVGGWQFALAWRTYRLGPLVAIVRRGLLIRMAGPTPQLIEWDRILRADVVSVLRRSSVELRLHGSPFHQNVSGVFRTRADADAFVAAIESRRRREQAGS